ncbi:MAG: hypothetical protein OXL98_15255 [Acidimicrobiaceae bacterium]|nr:hypothetical protein [Acidimicrobiaceae bacterium]
MGFKEDADFARFVSMGAVGAAAVARHLSTEHSHRMVELERYAMANKVWQTKVKRFRLPDLVCVRCGLRVEARAKSRLGIIVSHSDSPGRQWDAGMRDRDLYAFLRADLSTFPPETGLPSFFTTAALRSTVQDARRTAPKAASEGSEITLSWPCWVPSRPGRFERIDSDGRIVYHDIRGRERKYWQWSRWSGDGRSYLQPREPFEGGETIVAGIVPEPENIDCPGDIWKLDSAVAAGEDTDRYAAIKAAGVVQRFDLHEQLVAVRSEQTVDWRLRLEAAASLARLDAQNWTDALVDFAFAVDAVAEQRMEAVLALSEQRTRTAAEALAGIAATVDLPQELRAAAAWGLGQGPTPQPTMLLQIVLDPQAVVSLHAIAAMDHLDEHTEATLVEWLTGTDERRADIAAHLLSRHRRISVLLDACEHGGASRVRALSALGGLPRGAVRLAAGVRLTPQLQTALEPMWHSQTSWLKTHGPDALEALDVQKVRFDPTSPGDPWQTGTD